MAAGYGSVIANKTGDTVTMGNDAISRTWSIKDGVLKTTEINNKLGKSKFTPQEGSEEFYIEQLVESSRVEPSEALTSVKPAGKAPATATVEVSSTMDEAGNAAANAIDGDPATYWCSEDTKGGQSIIINFDGAKTVASFEYTPRVSGTNWDCTGRIKKYVLEYKQGDAWTEAARGEFNATGKTAVQLNKAVTTTALRLTATESHHWDANKINTAINVAEFDAKDAAGKSVVTASATTSWSAEASSVQNGDGGGVAALFDGNVGTYFHSRYNNDGTGTTNQMPVDITIDRGEGAKSAFQTVGYAGRPGSATSNGNVQKFELYVADSKSDLYKETSKKGSFTVDYAGAYDGNTSKMIYFGLDEAQSGRYVGFRVTQGANGNFVSGSELDLFAEKFTSVPKGEGSGFAASKLKLKDVAISDTTDKPGKMIAFTFDAAQFGSADGTVVEKVVMYDGDHFMRKFLEVKLEDETARINFIDGEHIVTSSDDTMWTVPKESGVVQMDAAKATLGQPIYVNGLFMGSEFPETDTQIADSLGRTRYWTGKNFADFKRDNQLTTDGKYVSWQTVCGATHSNGSDMNVVQSDFYAYITSISKPSEFRIQYNSWFDNMMFIDDENIIESFKAVDKQLSETGVRPLESYVVDDGWNQYRKNETQYTTGDDLRRNGSVDGKYGVNNTGFWQFNNKFPDGLTPSSNLVRKLGSNFGVWIGPRGGYNYYGNLASIIQDAGKGSSAGGSIDVADQRYVTNFTDMAVTWMEDYGVNYWKWDGFADSAQYGAFASGESAVGYDEAHQHMYGGPNGYFHATDLWEKWIVLFDKVWETASTEQIEDLWISLTCYVNPSPWFLQWSNSVWIQCVGDRGEVHGGAGNDKMNTMLTYRDACYYEFINSNQFQFPLANLYNHDPIYGKEGTGITADSMDGEQFRNYLFMQGTRGTAFWELYYSDSLFNDEKYLINADFLAWEEGNFDMLRNAKWIGGDPASNAGLTSNPTVNTPGTQEAYGFSGFNTAGNEGIISMRNPANAERTIEFTLDAGIGCTEDGTYQVVRDHVYTQGGKSAAEAPRTIAKGQKVSVTLKPGETQIWHLSKGGDTTAPTFERLYNEGNTTLRVQASEHVYNTQLEVLIDGKKVELAEDAITAYADLKTFDITLPAAPANGAAVEIKAIAGADSAGNTFEGSIVRTFHADGLILSGTRAAGSVEGPNGFTVVATVKDAAADTVLLSQGDQWALGIDAEGKAYFTVNGVTATSESTVSGITTISGARENNGMLKLYVNGEISGNGYDVEKTAGYSIKAGEIKVDAAATDYKVYDRALGYDEVPASPLEDLIAETRALKDKVTAESWAAANMDALLEQAEEALKSGDTAAQQAAYDALRAARAKLVPGLGEPEFVNHAKGKNASAHWTADDSAAENNPDRPASMAVDGEKGSSAMYGEFGHDDRAESSYLQVDLGAIEDVTGINLVRFYSDGRTYPNTTIVLSEDETFDADDTIVYNSDADNKNGFGKGEDEAYAETAEGKSFDVARGTKARYVRVYMNGNTRPGHTGNTNHVVELEVMGPEQQTLGDPFGIEKLDAIIAQAKTALENKDSYTADSVAQLETALKSAEEFAAKVRAEIEAGTFETTYGEFDAACDALQKAIDALELAKPESQQEHTVTFDYGYEGVAPESVTVVDGKAVTKPNDPIRAGYVFKGWTLNGKVYDFSAAVTGDITLVAQWEKAGSTNPDDPSKPGSGTTEPSKPGTGLPGTGDSTLLMVGGIAIVGIGIAAAGLALAKHRR